MELILTALQTLLGLVFTFSGANIYRSSPPLGGFVIGGLIGSFIGRMFLAAPPDMAPWVTLASFVAGGIVGALLAVPLHGVAFVLTAAVFGVLVGAIAGYIVNQQGITRLIIEGALTFDRITPIQAILMTAFALFFAFLSVRFDEMMIMVSTAFIGSLAATSGLATVGASRLPVFGNSIFLYFFWFALGLFGWIWQNYHRE